MTTHSPDRTAAENAALAALDAVNFDEQAFVRDASDPVSLNEFQKVTAALAEVASMTPPADLRRQALASALAKRAPLSPLRTVERCSPAAAFRQTVDELHVLLLGLGPDEWRKPALASYGAVRDLVAHLTGVEENLLDALAEGPAPDPKEYRNHVESTVSFVETLRSFTTDAITQRWYASARLMAATAEQVKAASPDRIIAVNDVPAQVDGMFVLRTFEIWTHHEDICRATGRPFPVLDAARLRTMSSDLMDALPVAMTMQGNARQNRTARVVLTGDGGSTFDVALGIGSPVGAPDVLIVADVVEFCRLAANRRDRDTVPLSLDGDTELANLVLCAAGAFACD